MKLPFVQPYRVPNPDSNFWGEVTSTIDWCEENYVVSRYIAEYINTLSNLFFISLAIYATSSSIINKLERRFTLIALGFGLVGFGSFFFHMTLKYEYQLLDELPMIYATCIPTWSVLSEGYTSNESRTIAMIIVLGSQLLTGIYLYFQNPLIHQIAYALLNFCIFWKSIKLTKEFVYDSTSQRKLFKCMGLGAGMFALGFGLWNLDIQYCSNWIDIRRSIGRPYAYIFELHGWWHILTGLGVYYYLVYLEYLRVFLIHKENEYEFVERFGIFPELILKKVQLKEDMDDDDTKEDEDEEELEKPVLVS